jgi:hypothetical protein
MVLVSGGASPSSHSTPSLERKDLDHLKMLTSAELRRSRRPSFTPNSPLPSAPSSASGALGTAAPLGGGISPIPAMSFPLVAQIAKLIERLTRIQGTSKSFELCAASAVVLTLVNQFADLFIPSGCVMLTSKCLRMLSKYDFTNYIASNASLRSSHPFFW